MLKDIIEGRLQRFFDLLFIATVTKVCKMDLVRLFMSEVSDSSLFLYLESIAFHIFIFKEFRGIANKTVKNIGNFNLSTYVFFSVIHFLLENKVIQSCKS